MWNSVRRSFDAFMVLIYVFAGVFILAKAEYFNRMNPYTRILFGIGILAYGLFRLYKLIVSFRTFGSEEDSDETE